MTDPRYISNRDWRRSRGPDLYLAYRLLASLYFWGPIKWLYLATVLPLREVVLLEGLYQGATFLLEVPSGYLSDRLGRRPCLVAAALCRVASAVVFVARADFASLAAAQLALAAADALRSGTEVSLHYGMLEDLERTSEFEAREARIHGIHLVSLATAALLGGLAGTYDYRLPFVLQAIAAGASLLVALALVEPATPGTGPSDEPPQGFSRSLRTCATLLRDPTLAWATGALVVAKLLDHLPYNFYQPYLELLGTPALAGWHPALVAGGHMATTMLVGTWMTRRSLRAADAVGFPRLVLLVLAGQLAMVLAMGSILHVAVLGLVLLREAPNALLLAPWRAAVVPRAPAEVRATFLSVVALLRRLATGLMLWLLSGLAGGDSPATFAGLGRVLMAGAGLCALGLVGLALTTTYAPVRPERQLRSYP